MVSKQELLGYLNNPAFALTGRVKSWLLDPESRYPVSCTVLSIEDSMEGHDGIDFSGLYTSKGLRYGAGVALDFSKIRPAGSTNSKGLVASGPVSFMKEHSVKNEILRRGGLYKNGAVVCYLDADHQDLFEFLYVSPSYLPWAKKALYIDPETILTPYFTEPLSEEDKAKVRPEDKKLHRALLDFIGDKSRLELILDAVRNGTVWLAKKQYDANGNRLYSNVCLEILLRSRGTCLLSHVNLGQVNRFNLSQAFVESMQFLCDLHALTGMGIDNYYLPPEEDRQVGLGVIGLANFLAKEGISYKDFANALYDYGIKFNESKEGLAFKLANAWASLVDSKKYPIDLIDIADSFYLAFHKAAEVARLNNMERAFTVAPTATCSYKYTDEHGYTTTPEISPPICHPKTKRVQRDSSTFGVEEFQYPLNVETAAEVGFETYMKLASAWQMMMDSTGLGHSISFNVWSSCPVDQDWFKSWLDSPLKTTYYRMFETQDFVDKTNIAAGMEDDSIFSKSLIEEDDEDDEEVQAYTCNLQEGYCEACGS